MADRLTIEDGPVYRGKPTKKLKRFGEGGAVLAEIAFSFTADYHHDKAARVLGVDRAVLSKLLLSGKPELELESKPKPVERIPPRYMLRAEGQTIADGTWHADIETAIKGQGIITWDHDAAYAVDLDFHKAPEPHDLSSVMRTLEPAPRFWWITKSGGCRCIYLELPPYKARELAAVAGASLLRRYPSATLELKQDTRTPPGEWFSETQTAPSLGYLLGESGEGDYAAWLEERGLEIGGRYEHDRCPVNPSPRAASNTPPVVVHEDGVHCYICQADGVCFGSRSPGHFPATRLSGGQSRTTLGRCVDGMAHWGHAKHVIANVQPLPEDQARGLYAALLHRRHGDDPRVDSVFAAGEPMGLMRCGGYWATSRGEPVPVDKQSRIIMGLPAARYVDEDGEVQVSGERTEWLAGNTDLAPIGYPSLTPVWGARVTRHQDPPEGKVFVVLNSGLLSAPHCAGRRPRYLPPSKRMARAAAWSVLSSVFPGLRPEVIELLIAAKGCTEHRSGLPPMLFLSGPTGSGKTASAKIAASICGDMATIVPFAASPERLRQGLMYAKRNGSFACFDEYVKDARKAKTTPADAMEVLLNFTPESVSHMLYVGPVPLGDLPVCYWADTTLPVEVQQHAQLARRLHHIHLPEAGNWEPTMRAQGIGAPERLRSDGTPELIAAADAILSHVIDEHFPPGPPSDFAEIAKGLGFKLMRDSDHAGERDVIVRRLFDLVCAAPRITGPEAKRWPGSSWRLIDLSRDTELVETWRLLADLGDPTNSRAVDELDLKRVLGLKCSARLDRRSHGQKVVVRFADEQGYHFNEELRDASIPVASKPTDTDGPGDAQPS